MYLSSLTRVQSINDLRRLSTSKLARSPRFTESLTRAFLSSVALTSKTGLGQGRETNVSSRKVGPSSQSVPRAMAAERATDKDGDVEMESKDSSVQPLLAENLGRAALGADSPSFALSKVCTSEVAGSAPQQITCGYVVSRSLLSGPMAILCVELRYKGTSRLQKERKHHRTRTSSCFPRLISRRDVSPSEMMAPLVCGYTP